MKNKLLTFLLAAAVSIGLWLYVVTFISPNSDHHYYNIPVTLQGEALLQDRGLMITNQEHASVSLHLEGNRTYLNRLNTSNITISADVSKIGEAGVHKLTYTPIYPGDIPNNSITILSQTPGTITVEVENRVVKEVPVEVRYTGTLPEGYMADKENKVLDHEMITVSGPESVVDQVAAAYIDVDLEQQVESISQAYQYTLANEKGEPVDVQMVTTNVEQITLTLKILRVKELSVVVNVIDGGGASEETSSITVQPSTILVSGSDNLLEGLDVLELGTINLGEMLEDEVLTFEIKLPEGVTNETGVTEATVEVRFPELAMKTLTVSNIQAVNVPEGLTAELITQQLEITIRGPKKTVEEITADQITVTVDLTDAQLGMATVKAEIKTSDETVGAVGIYNITVKLKQSQ